MKSPAQGGASLSLVSDCGSSAPKPADAEPDWQATALMMSIRRAREAAHGRACYFRSYDAGAICNMATHFAAAWAFRRKAPLHELEQALEVLTHLFLAADALEKLEGGDAK